MMSGRLQKFLANLDLVIPLLFLLSVSLVWILEFDVYKFTNPDAYDYAQMGREIARGNGFSTLQVFPRHIPTLAEKGLLNIPHWPNLYRYPLPTYLNAFFNLWLPDIIVASVVQSGIWFLLGIPLVFWITRQVANRTVATLATLFYVGDPVLWLYSYNGLTESSATFILLLIAGVALSKSSLNRQAMILGVLSGLAFLDRTQLVFVLPITLVYIWWKTQSPMRYYLSAVMCLLAFLVMLPWLLNNYLLMGDPLFSFSNVRNIVYSVPGPGIDIEMQLHAPADTWSVIQEYGVGIAVKFARNTIPEIISLEFWANMFSTYFPFLLFFLMSFFHKDNVRNQHWEVLKWGSAIIILANFLVLGLGRHEPRFYIICRPFVLIVGLVSFVGIISSMLKQKRMVLKGLTICLFIFGFVQFSLSAVTYRHMPSNYSVDIESYTMVAESAPAESIIASDASYKVSLHATRRALRLPTNPKELLEINEKYISVDFVLLTGCSVVPGSEEGHSTYCRFVSTPEFLSVFKLIKQLPNGALFFKKI